MNYNLDKRRFLALEGRDGRRGIASRPAVRNAGEQTKNIEFLINLKKAFKERGSRIVKLWHQNPLCWLGKQSKTMLSQSVVRVSITRSSGFVVQAN